MKTKNILRAALSMTAALAMTACTSDDNTAETTAAQQAEAKTIPYSVTVSGGDATTRATVDDDLKTLRFADGDKLYITGTDISGQLALKSGDAGKASGATFEGSLNYTGEGTPASDLALTATLVSAQQTDGTEVTINPTTKAVTVNYPNNAYCADVATAVEKYSNLSGTSTYGAKAFTLAQQTAFLNFEITFYDGTAAGTALSAVVSNGGTDIATAAVETKTESEKVVAKFVLPVASTTAISGATVKMGTKALLAFGTSGTLAGKVYNVKKTQGLYSFRLRNLADDADVTATALTVTDQAGNAISTTSSDGTYAIKQSDLGTTAKALWFAATTASGNYIAKADIEELDDIASSGKLLMATLGDLMGQDGKFYADAAAISAANTTAIGVIAYLGSDATTEAIANGGGHGLVLCLKNAASGSDAQWSTEKSAFEFGEDAKVASADALKRTTNVSGYTNTKTLAEKTDAATKYKAAYAAKNYSGLTASTGTTGWFLPSAQQWVKMLTGLGALDESSITWNSWFDNSHTAADKWEAALSKAGSGNYDSMTSAWLYYWSSSEYSAIIAVRLAVHATGTGGDCGFCWGSSDKGIEHSDYRVRPVLAF